MPSLLKGAVIAGGPWGKLDFEDKKKDVRPKVSNNRLRPRRLNVRRRLKNSLKENLGWEAE